MSVLAKKELTNVLLGELICLEIMHEVSASPPLFTLQDRNGRLTGCAPPHPAGSSIYCDLFTYAQPKTGRIPVSEKKCMGCSDFLLLDNCWIRWKTTIFYMFTWLLETLEEMGLRLDFCCACNWAQLGSAFICLGLNLCIHATRWGVWDRPRGPLQDYILSVLVSHSQKIWRMWLWKQVCLPGPFPDLHREKGLCFWFQFVAKMGPPCSIPHPRVFKFCLNWKSRGDQFGTKRTDDAFVFPGTIFAYSAASTAPLLLSPPHRPPLPFRLQCVISQIFCAKLWQTWSWAVRMVLFFSAVGGCSCINLKRTISNDKQTKQMHPQASEIQI